MPKRILSDWIETFLSYTENSEPPTSFRLWTAISTVAAVLQRKVSLTWGSEVFYPNLYVVLVGPSSSRKGTAMNPALRMLRRIGIKVASNAVTREALIKELNDAGFEPSALRVNLETGTMTTHSSLTVFSKELTVFLGYKNLELMSNLCDWFDCDDKWTYTTKNAGIFEINGVWFNLIGGTTPDLLQAVLPVEAIGSGLTSRIIFIYEKQKEKRVVMPMTDKKVYEHLVTDLEAIHLMSGPFKVTEGFIETYANWYSKTDNNKFCNPRFEGYCGRRPTHLFKMSMICSASRGDSYILTEDDFKRALKYLREAEVNMESTFAGIGRSDNASVTDQILSYIALKEKIEFSELMARFYRDADRDTFHRVMRTLQEMEYVIMPIEGTKVFVKLNPKYIRMKEEQRGHNETK